MFKEFALELATPAATILSPCHLGFCQSRERNLILPQSLKPQSLCVRVIQRSMIWEGPRHLILERESRLYDVLLSENLSKGTLSPL